MWIFNCVRLTPRLTIGDVHTDLLKLRVIDKVKASVEKVHERRAERDLRLRARRDVEEWIRLISCGDVDVDTLANNCFCSIKFHFSTAAAAAALCFSTAASKMTSWTSFIQSTKAKRIYIYVHFLLKQRTTTDHSPAMRSADDSSIACRIQRRAPNCQCRRAAAPARTRRTNSARRNKSRLDYSVIIFFRIEKWHYLLSFWPTFLIKLEIRTHII